MRLKALLSQDIRFQYKYGFYFLYLIFSLLYVALLITLPATWREKAAVLLIFSDPAALGLYFMGAIVLLEKSERVLNSIAISPVKADEYMLSKLLSIAVVSTAAGLIIGFFSKGIVNYYFVAGVFLCSCLFSGIGLIIAARSVTLNGFILSTIPAELLISIPAFAYLFRWQSTWLLFHPGVAMIELCIGGPRALPALLSLTLWTTGISWYAGRAAAQMLRTVGGVKL